MKGLGVIRYTESLCIKTEKIDIKLVDYLFKSFQNHQNHKLKREKK